MTQHTKQVTIEYIDAKLLLAEFAKIYQRIDEIGAIISQPKNTVYIDRKRVAEILNVSEVTVNDWKNKGHIKSYKICNRVRYIESEIIDALVPTKIR